MQTIGILSGSVFLLLMSIMTAPPLRARPAQARPTITKITPANGAPGTTFNASISGTNLNNALSVTFSGTGITAAISFSGDNAIAVRITIDATAALGVRTFTVTTASGSSLDSGVFLVAEPLLYPVINTSSAGDPTGLSQAFAPVYGPGFTLTITGRNFVSGAVVYFGQDALSTTFVSSTVLTATVPASALRVGRTAPIFVRQSLSAALGEVNSNTVDFGVVERGDVNGSKTVNIGDALSVARSVAAITSPALTTAVADINLNDSTNIGDALVLARFSGGLVPNFPSPEISSVSCTSSCVAGAPFRVAVGSVLSISGTGFSGTAANNRVSFTAASNQAVSATPSASTSTSLTVTVPAGALSGPIQVYRSDFPAGSQEFPLLVDGTSTPLTVTSVAPYYLVQAGSSVILTGTGFDAVASNNTVRFTGAAGPAEVTAATTSSLTVTVPALARCGSVTVATGAATSNARAVVIAGTTCPLALADSLGASVPGQVMVLEGTGFDKVIPSYNTVQFTSSSGRVVAPVVQSGTTQLQVVVPCSAVEGDFSLAQGPNSSNALRYVPPPAIVPTSVDVIITSTIGVGGYQVDIGYNSAILRLEDSSVSGGTASGFTERPTTVNNSTAGTVTLNHYHSAASQTGTLIVARLAFRAVAAGTSNLTVTTRALVDVNGNNIPAPAAITLSSTTVTSNYVCAQ